ncbi:hypothetical protein GUITHDRAFT_76659 [Guillardia theta CCMP2712]|uniref:JmjC domain-containing protein n=1 Tax=Guillardia theta (strain CCMP2712) TaxID=905079 RepID=L1IT43_GUITC|nr:hypothetical protein GUITHDRAFT_76659 [Guillardia theta CCMP2712]EKX39010.1 hypothetical protein GUITHDRAFT_76659 [Guillardia theta CCMP2712]|eukprot:XP_005825990.1 hypothetical protein GUITHDRAFT_76659 [Guillardia theta CCMP2712]
MDEEPDFTYEEAITDCKKRIRPEFSEDEWSAKKFHALDLEVLNAPQENCDKIHVNDFTVEEFVDKYETASRPCIIRGAMDGWRAYGKWSLEWLAQEHGDVELRCGDDEEGERVEIKLSHFVRYMQEQEDDNPLYVFDENFADDEKETASMAQDFSIPTYFQEDLFKYLGEDDRPPYRWVLVGPKRSGSSIHIDPCGTSAWNSLLAGRKRWVLFPPGTPRSVIKPESWLAQKRSEALDWFLYHLDGMKQQLPAHQQPVEVIMEAGETIFVPGGWWHTVLNLEDTIAVTQNFVSSNNFMLVYQELKTSRTKLSRKWLRSLSFDRQDLVEVLKRNEKEEGKREG